MTEKIMVSGKKFGKLRFVRDFIPFKESVLVQKYRMGLQIYTFILINIRGFDEILYIQNLEKDFFSTESKYNIDYIKNLKVECVMNFTKENTESSLDETKFESKYIGN